VGLKHLWVVPVGADASLPAVIGPNGADFAEGDATAFAELEAAGDPPAAILGLSMARFLDVTKGDVITLSFRLGAERRDARVRVAAVAASIAGFDGLFRSRAANAQGSGVLLSRKAFDAMTASAPREAFEGFALAKADGDGREAAKAVRESMGLRYGLGVECAEEERREAEGLYWGTQVLFALLLAVAVAIAFFGLVASMATAAIERRREIGILKAVGVRRGALQKMFSAEATALTLSSGLLGGGMGFLLAWLFILQAALLMEVPAVFAPPWLTFLATFAVCGIAGRLAAWLPLRGLLRRPVAEILRG
jgi:ABC-type lipoprotein release transport system permease subunit